MNHEQTLLGTENFSRQAPDTVPIHSRGNNSTSEQEDLSRQEEEDDDDGGEEDDGPEEGALEIKFRDWGSNMDRLFEVAYRFYKRNESKAFQLSFDARNQMNALVLQARYGNFDEGRAVDIGMLDLVGKSRRHQWSLLNGMSKAEAMSNFICTLDEICPLFKVYAEAVKISSGCGSQEPAQSTEERLNGSDSARQTNQHPPENGEQLRAIHTSLCRQTYNQFKSYAEKQYPDNPPEQRQLITSLQEQYYQQYISQISPSELGAGSSSSNTDSSSPSQAASHELLPPPPPSHQTQPDYPITPTRILPSHSYEPQHDNYHDNQPVEESRPAVDTWSCGSSSTSGAGSPLQQQSIAYEPLEPATIWTKKGVNEFKDSLIDDKHGGAYMVKQGTLLTIQVPTYPDGRYIYWEFVTEDYDIGFGLDFIHEPNPIRPLAMKIQEQTDEDDFDDSDGLDLDEGDSYDLASGSVEADRRLNVAGSRRETLERKRAENCARLANTVSILPVYRRDSHEEVFVGRHRYPGQGYYVLKFDNTYSVLREKSLFFRICYFV